LTHKTLKLFRIESSRALAVRMWCSRFMIVKKSGPECLLASTAIPKLALQLAELK